VHITMQRVSSYLKEVRVLRQPNLAVPTYVGTTGQEVAKAQLERGTYL